MRTNMYSSTVYKEFMGIKIWYGRRSEWESTNSRSEWEQAYGIHKE